MKNKYDACSFRKCRESCGMTAQETATALGVSISTLLRWEAGQASPPCVRALQMAKLYKCSVGELLESSR